VHAKLYEEGTLLREAAGGSESAFTELFHYYKDKLYSFLLRLTESPEMAEDVIQDIFLKLWKSRAGLTGIDNFGSYIFRMAQNQCLTHFKRVARETLILAELQREATVPDTENTEALRAMQQKLEAVVAQLPPQQRLIYTLSREQGLKHEEIARRLAISPSTVKNHMIQALSSIRKELAPYARTGAFVTCFIALIEAFEK